MPVVFTFDIQKSTDGQVEYNRIRSAFERLGWEHLGGTAYRYPRLGTENKYPVEDWFNHVIPALMLFRTYLLKSEHTLTKYTLDIQSSAGMNNQTDFGTPPVADDEMTLYDPSTPQFSKDSLLAWINEIKNPSDYRRQRKSTAEGANESEQDKE